MGTSPFSSTVTACSSTYTWPGGASSASAVYEACEPVLLATRTVDWEGTGAAGPYTEQDFTYDDYRTSTAGLGNYAASPATGSYHNTQQEVISSSNAPTETMKWTYDTTNTTVNSVVYYDVNKVAHSEIDDSGGTAYSCVDNTYDEGISSSLPLPSAGWPTTVTTYSKCGDATTAIKTYTGYDVDGNAVAAVDGLEASNPGTFGSKGCTLSTAPAIFPTGSWSGTHYTSCTAYNTANGLPTDTWNALNQHGIVNYDATQGLLVTGMTDINGQVTGESYSYDSSGNATTRMSEPGETSPSGYTKQGINKSTCTASSTFPVSGNRWQYLALQ